MQKLFYIVTRWLDQDNSRQSSRICNMIKDQMQQVGFNYQSISSIQHQREQLYRQRQKLIKQKQKLQEQKRQIQEQRQHNLKLIEQKEKLQGQRQVMERMLMMERGDNQNIREENSQLECKRQSMINQYEILQDQRDKIIQQRQLLYERMQKIQKLQTLQKMYQQQLKRLRQQSQHSQIHQQQKQQQEQQNQMQVKLTKQSQNHSTQQFPNQPQFISNFRSGFSNVNPTNQYTLKPIMPSSPFQLAEIVNKKEQNQQQESNQLEKKQ